MRVFSVLPWKTYFRLHGVTSAEVNRVSWRKSTFSSMNGSCVEIARILPGRIGVRDTKDNGAGPVLFFTDPEWAAFVAGVREGEFDNP